MKFKEAASQLDKLQEAIDNIRVEPGEFTPCSDCSDEDEQFWAQFEHGEFGWLLVCCGCGEPL